MDGSEQTIAAAELDPSSAALLVGLDKYISWQETLETTIDDFLRREKELGIVV